MTAVFGEELQAVDVWGQGTEARPALTQRLLNLYSAQEEKPHLHLLKKVASHQSCDETTMCGSLGKRSRASTWDDREEPWPLLTPEATPDQEGDYCSDEEEALPMTRQQTNLSCKSSGYCSLSSFTGARASGCSSRRGSEVTPIEPASTKTVPASCGSGCFAWMTRPRKVAAKPKRSGPGLVEYDINRLVRVGLLGCGSFGTVTLEKCQVTGQFLALKAVSKGHLAERGLHSSLVSEKQAMKRCDSPFIVKLAATFNVGQYLYFLQEAVTGGDLYSTYGRRLLFGSDKHGRFYTACIVRALEHLHEHNIIYRDMKMENVVLDSRGYGKLCDFGLAAVLESNGCGKTYTVCGTSEYMAPEVSEGTTGYTRAADWWSLGILIYELMVGETPFVDEDPSLIHLSVCRGIQEADLPAVPWADVVRELCLLEPTQRLPMRERGMERLEQKAWFEEAKFDWAAHSKCAMPAPYVPRMTGPQDLSNFCTGQQLPAPAVYWNEDESCSAWDTDFEDRGGPCFD